MWAILLSVHYRGGRDTECESIDPRIGVVTRATTSTRISDEKGVLICGAAVRRSYRAFARQAWNRGTASSFSLSLCREDFRPVFRLGGYGEKGFIIFFFFFREDRMIDKWRRTILWWICLCFETNNIFNPLHSGPVSPESPTPDDSNARVRWNLWLSLYIIKIMEWGNINFLKKLNSSDLVKFKDVIYIYNNY